MVTQEVSAVGLRTWSHGVFSGNMASSGPERQWCGVHQASRTDTQEQLTTTGDEDVNVSPSKGGEKIL